MQKDEQLFENWQGKQLGNYHLRCLVGRGGFAQVYQGEHVHLQILAAIKVLQARLSRQDQENFLSEAQMIARLRHPNIIQVLEFGIAESVPYLVMDYAPGGTLRQRYPIGSVLTPLRILPYLKQLSSALQYAHEQHIVHRDIKPENMLLGPDGKLLLADFGIALGVQSSCSHSMADVAGTVTYMAPELLRGRAIPASDQYALAAVVYEWLAGAPPFRGTFVEVASQHLFTPPPSLRQLSVSNEVEQVVLTALHKEPERRFAHVLEFATAFEQAALMGSVEETIRGRPRRSRLQHIELERLGSEQGVAEQQAGSATPPGSDVTARPSAATPVLSQQQAASSASDLPASTIACQARRLADKAELASVPAALSLAIRPRGRLLMLIAVVVLSVLLCSECAGSGAILLYSGLVSPRVSAPLSPGNWRVISLSARQAQALYSQATSRPVTYASTMVTNDNYHWLTGRDDVGSCSFAGGAYHVAVTVFNMPEDCAPGRATFSDLALQAQLTIVRGDSGGLAFRASTNQGVYFFGFDKDGGYSLIASFGGTFYMLLLGSSPAIVTGLNHPNLLTVIAQGTSIFLYINRHYVGGVTASMSREGFLSIFAWSLNSRSATTEVVCHGVQIWKLT